MNKKPKIKIPLTSADKILEILAGLFLILTWLLLLTYYSRLPETIPTHYNHLGHPDNFGSKASVFTLPIVATLIFVGLSILSKYPHTFNYPTIITEDNAFRHYTNATRLIRYMKLIIVVIFGLITLQTIRYALAQTNGLGLWIMPLVISLIIIPVVYYLVRSAKVKNW